MTYAADPDEKPVPSEKIKRVSLEQATELPSGEDILCFLRIAPSHRGSR